MSDAVAVVVPTLNEAARIGLLLDRLLQCGFAEIVVADGGGMDATVAQAQARSGVTVVSAPRGRGLQMNAGARACSSPKLLFPHADTEPPPEAPRLIRRALARPNVAAGAFRAEFGPLTRLYAACTRFETGLTTFGDQGFFMRPRPSTPWAGSRPALPGGRRDAPPPQAPRPLRQARGRGRHLRPTLPGRGRPPPPAAERRRPGPAPPGRPARAPAAALPRPMRRVVDPASPPVFSAP